MTQQNGNEAFEAIVAPLAAERAAAANEGTYEGTNTDWSLNGFGELYISERDRLVSIANRYLKDLTEAEDVVQEAFLKCAMAAPDLANRDHAVAYLTRTVVNTALNVVRTTSRRATPVEDLATANLDSREIDAWNPAADDALMRAADTALVTEALSRLTDAQRTALLLTASGDYSTKQVAEVLNISEQQVYTQVSRARSALRRALESIVVDAETGMTAADQLSTVVKSAKKNAKKIGQGAAALLLVMAVGLGFWNYTATPSLQQLLPESSATTTQVPASSAATAEAQATAEATAQATATANAQATKATPSPTATLSAAEAALLRSAPKKAPAMVWPGADANGVPTAFTVSDGQTVGNGQITLESTDMDASGMITSTSDFMTVSTDGVNVLLHQTLVWADGELTYSVVPLVRMNGAWNELSVAALATERTTLADGTILLDAHILVENAANATSSTSGPAYGTDVTHLPQAISLRIHTSESGTPILGESVIVIDPLQQLR